MNSAERAGLRPKGNVPTLRFPEFRGEWHRTTIGECCSPLEYGMNAPAKEYDGKNKYIRITDIDEETCTYKYDDVVSPNALLEEKYKVLDNDILFARTGASTGKAYLYDKKDGLMYYAGFLIRGNVKPDFNSKFVFLQTQTQKYKKWVDIMSIRSGQPGINSQEYSSFKFHLPPSKVEQDKISTLFTLLDVRITTQIRIIEDLKSERKFLLEQLFCLPKEHTPKLRLKGMTGDWYKVRLYDIVERITERNKANTCSRVLTIAAQYGLIDQQEFFNKQIASSDLTTYYLLHKGDFAYNKSYSGDYPWGAVKRLDNYNEGVLSSLYVCFRPNGNVDSDFLCHYFESTKWYRGISEISGEGARNHGLLNMSVDDYFNTIHRIPSLEEQRQISTMFNTIVQKIKIEESIIDKLQKQKSYLLKEMFV